MLTQNLPVNKNKLVNLQKKVNEAVSQGNWFCNI